MFKMSEIVSQRMWNEIDWAGHHLELPLSRVWDEYVCTCIQRRIQLFWFDWIPLFRFESKTNPFHYQFSYFPWSMVNKCYRQFWRNVNCLNKMISHRCLKYCKWNQNYFIAALRPHKHIKNKIVVRIFWKNDYLPK